MERRKPCDMAKTSSLSSVRKSKNTPLRKISNMVIPKEKTSLFKLKCCCVITSGALHATAITWSGLRGEMAR